MKPNLLVRVFNYLAFITFVWAIAEAAIYKLNILTILTPTSFLKFAGICLLFSIALTLKQLLEKEK